MPTAPASSSASSPSSTASSPTRCGSATGWCSSPTTRATATSTPSPLDGSDLRRHSDHTGNYARDLGGDLEGGATRAGLPARRASSTASTTSPPTAEPVPIEVELPGARVARQPTLAPVDKSLADAEVLSVDATGRASAVNIRGTVQWLTHRDGPVRALADTPGVRTRLPRVRPEAQVRDLGDRRRGRRRARTHRRRRHPPDRRAAGRPGARTRRRARRRARRGRHPRRPGARRRARRRTRARARQQRVSATRPGWPSRRTRPGWPGRSRTSRSCARSSSPSWPPATVHDATPERFVDTSPAFTPDGKYLAFLSARTFDPVYDTHNFDLSFTVGVRPYLIPLRADTPSPFDPEGRDGRSRRRTTRTTSANGGKGSDDAGSAVEVRVDLDGLSERTVVVPVAAGLHTDLRAAKGGLLWLTHPITGVIGAGLPEGAEPPRPTLWRWDFAARRSDAAGRGAGLVPALRRRHPHRRPRR